MLSQRQGPSHCVVQWDDNQIEYAIVDTQRAKTVSGLKIGSTTLFCGDNRARRRGKILFMGTSLAQLAHLSSRDRILIRGGRSLKIAE